MKKSIKALMILILFALAAASAYAAVKHSVPDRASIVLQNKSWFGIYDTDYQFVSQRPDPAEPGSYVEVRLKVENIGGKAEDVIVEVIPEFPFSLETGKNTKVLLGELSARQVGTEGYVVYYKLKVDENAVEGNNQIRFRYSIDNGRSWFELPPFYIRVQSHDAILSIDSVSSAPEEVSPGDEVSLDISITNIADSALKSMRFFLELDGTDFTPLGSSNEKTIKLLEPKQSSVLQFNLIAQASAESKAHRIPLKIDYFDELGKNYTRRNYIGIIVNEKPKYISNIDSTDIFTKNKKGKVIISISNVGSSKIKYLTLKMKQTDDYAVLSSPEVYLGNLDSDDFDSAEFQLYMKSKKRSVPLLFDAAFRDSFNRQYSEELSLELPLYSSSEVKKYSLEARKGILGALISIIAFVVLTVFWLFMLMKCIRTPMIRYRKILWLILVIGGYVAGAALFYFMAKKKIDK